MSTAEFAVQVHGLTKRYGETLAVDHLDLEQRRGEVLAVLGPNGAGKTTTVEILEGYRKADSGSVRVLGLDPWRQGPRLKPHIGVMLQEGGLYPTITPREAVTLFAGLYSQPRSPREVLEMVGLQGAADTRYRRLSGGQKQRLSLALALVPRPSMVFLDEPTAGMDPQARRATWDMMRQLRQEGVTILLTTHYLDEAERLADRVAIIHAGRLVAFDTPAALSAGRDSVRLETAVPINPDLLRSLTASKSVTPSGDAWVIETDEPPTLLVEITSLMRERSIPLVEMRVGSGTLEDAFLRLTGTQFES